MFEKFDFKTNLNFNRFLSLHFSILCNFALKMSQSKKQNQNTKKSNQPSNVFEESPWKLYLQVTLFTLGLGLVGFVSHPFFQSFSFSFLNKIEITTTQMGTQFELKMLYIAAFVLIPLMVFSIQKLLKLETFMQKVFVIASIFISGIIFWILQISSLNQQYQDMLKVKTPFPMKYTFALESLFLEFNLLVGFVIGAIFAAILLFRFNKRQSTTPKGSPKKIKR